MRTNYCFIQRKFVLSLGLLLVFIKSLLRLSRDLLKYTVSSTKYVLCKLIMQFTLLKTINEYCVNRSWALIERVFVHREYIQNL